MSAEMSRKQFLINLGMGFVALLGLSSLIGVLSKGDSATGDNLVGYGMRDYGP
jgi:hypothetical protein